MDIFELIKQLSSVYLTVQEQARTRENDPTLTYPGYFPPTPVPSVRLASITPVENVYISDRREWNADGRYIPSRLPSAKELEMVPLESWFAIDERQIQLWGEGSFGNIDLIISAAKIDIRNRVSSLTDSNIWANEYESLQAWTTGEIPVQNPQTGASYVADLGFDPDRYDIDTTPWTDSNAFDRLLGHAQQAMDAIGSIRGIVVRNDIAQLIAQSAPSIGANSIRMTLRQVQEYISDSLGVAFEIRIDERVKPKFDGAGTATTLTKLFPEDVVAFIPGDGRIGSTFQAPIYRAEDVSAASMPDSVDSNGQRIYYMQMNHGKSLKVQAQANWLAVPEEQRVYVANIQTP